MAPKGRVLIIAGSDSGGGAGVQADIKTVTALGGYAATAITALTVQNTLGVSAIHAAPVEIIAGQIEAVLSDIGADCIKIGMLGDAATVACVADALAAHAPGVPVVLDPVMIAKGGHKLLTDDAVEALRTRLAPRAALLTPNAPEAAALTGAPVETADDQRQAAAALRGLGAGAVLVKGGHLEGPLIRDVLVSDAGERQFLSARIDTKATHGTGCTLASAIAALLAQGVALEPAIERARAYLLEAIRTAPGLGQGHGPLNHGWSHRPR